MDFVIAFICILLFIILVCSVLVPLSIILFIVLLPFLHRFGIIERMETKDKVLEDMINMKNEHNGRG
jgi:hypothetical protein